MVEQAPISVAEFNKSNGSYCPWCGSSEIEAGPFESTDGGPKSRIACQACHREWWEYFTLDGYGYECGTCREFSVDGPCAKCFPRRRVHNPSSPCSCTVDHDGATERITYCPLHGAAAAILAALKATAYFRVNGYTKAAVWKFVGENPEHPAWYPFLVNGGIGLQKWLNAQVDAALAAAEGK